MKFATEHVSSTSKVPSRWGIFWRSSVCWWLSVIASFLFLKYFSLSVKHICFPYFTLDFLLCLVLHWKARLMPGFLALWGFLFSLFVCFRDQSLNWTSLVPQLLLPGPNCIPHCFWELDKNPFCRRHAPQLQPELRELGTTITTPYELGDYWKIYRKVNKGLKPLPFSLIKLSTVQQKLICVFYPITVNIFWGNNIIRGPNGWSAAFLCAHAHTHTHGHKINLVRNPSMHKTVENL